MTVRLLDPADARTAAALDAARAASGVVDGAFVRILDIDAGAPDGPPAHVVSAFVDGELLAEVLVDGPLDAVEAADLVADLADAVARAHTAGLAHGALDPVHVVVAPGGEVAVVDLGIAAALRGEPALDLTYDAGASPEGQRTAPAEGIADARHLGALLYACLTGRWPLPSPCGLPSAEVDGGRPLAPRRARARVPAALDRICRRALGETVGGEEPLDRARDLAAELRAWLGRSGTTAAQRAERRTTSTGPVEVLGAARPDRGRQVLVALVWIAVIVLVVGGAYLGVQVLDDLFSEPGGSPPPGPASTSTP